MAYNDAAFKQGMSITMAVGQHPHDKYQAFVAETAIFPNDRGIQYCVTKLNGEIGEFNAKVANAIGVGVGFTDYYFESLPPGARMPMIMELGDITWYVTALARQLDISLRDIANSWPNEEYQDGVTFIGQALYMSGYGGEIAEVTGKMIRDSGSDGTNTSFLQSVTYRQKIHVALVRLLAVLQSLASTMNYSFEDVINVNVEKLSSRRARGVLTGSGDNR